MSPGANGSSSMGEREAHITGRVEDPGGKILRLALSDGAVYEVAPDAPEAKDLSQGDAVDARRRAGLEAAAERKRLAREVFRLLDRRAYAVGRLRGRLLERGFSEAAVAAVLADFVEQGLLDDGAFSRGFCRDQLRRRPVGRRWLRHRLRQEGVAEEDVEAALDEVLDPDRERELARQALASRAPVGPTPQDGARALRFLRSRGFPDALARETVRAARGTARLELENDGP